MSATLNPRPHAHQHVHRRFADVGQYEIEAAADEVGHFHFRPGRLQLQLGNPVPKEGPGELLHDPFGLVHILAEPVEDAQRPGELDHPRAFPQGGQAHVPGELGLIGEQLVEDEAHGLRLPHPPHVLRPPRDDVLVGAHRGEAVGHAGFAEEALEERVLEIRIDLQGPLRELAHVHVVPPGDILFALRGVEDRAVGLAKAAPVALGNLIIDMLKLWIHNVPRI